MLEEECFAYWTVTQIVPTIVLHPPDNDRDVLLSAAHDPAVEESIQITADEMRERLYKLNRDSSAGIPVGPIGFFDSSRRIVMSQLGLTILSMASHHPMRCTRPSLHCATRPFAGRSMEHYEI